MQEESSNSDSDTDYEDDGVPFDDKERLAGDFAGLPPDNGDSSTAYEDSADGDDDPFDQTWTDAKRRSKEYGAHFRHKSTLDDVIGCHACSLEASMHVANGIPLGCSLLLPVGTVNCVQTLKARQ
jgi:hypothetical protein